MHFERQLKRTKYPGWEDKYIDYAKLKALLKEDGSDDGLTNGDEEWTEKDEETFVDVLINKELEKVHSFQSERVQALRDRTTACEELLAPLTAKGKAKEGQEERKPSKLDEKDEAIVEDVKKKLDSISTEMTELGKYARINYTGFLKAAKKHDRRRGNAYRVGPIMQVRLSELPFNSEDFTPLLFRVSTMYDYCNKRTGTDTDKSRRYSDYNTVVEHYTAQKYWVHSDNLLELKTVLARHLPLLVYNRQDLKVADGTQPNPSTTSIYFDNPQFSQYSAKVGQSGPATSLRIRWYDSLTDDTELFVEKKTVNPDDSSKEQRFSTTSKYLQAFLKGQHKMEQEVQRLEERVGEDSGEVAKLKEQIAEIQSDITKNNLQPMTRANYARAAYQMPGDNRVRVTLDTELAFIREDALDTDRPCRDPEDWHRKDIDDNDMEYPFTSIRKGEISRFPYAVLEIRIKGGKEPKWIDELTSSHLVKKAPRFSKFVHGTAQLFDDYVNTFPFWLSEVDTDIRIDPHQAYEEDQKRKSRIVEDEVAVGSFLDPGYMSKSPGGKLKKGVKSPIGSPTSSRAMIESAIDRRATAKSTRLQLDGAEDATAKVDGDDNYVDAIAATSGFRSYLPSLSTSKYAQAKRNKMFGSSLVLPEGVEEPKYWIKDEGEVKVEAKVYLANQRTFIKWQHVAILLASLSLGLFNAAGKDNNIARLLGLVYTILAVFIALWGWGIYMYRANLIVKRSGKDFDNIIGPCLVCVGLIAALCLNFAFKYQALKNHQKEGEEASSIMGLQQVMNGSY